MTVGDLQKYVRGLADAIGAATKSPAKDLLDVAERLVPFAHYPMDTFAEFLKVADDYRTTGTLPDPVTSPKQGKSAKPPAPPKSPPSPKAQPGEVLALVEQLRDRVLSDATLTREAVDSTLRAYEKRLTKPQWLDVVKQAGFSKKAASIGDAIQTLVNHVMARKAGVHRADA